MKKLAIINGSPRKTRGASGAVTKEIKTFISEKYGNEKILSNIFFFSGDSLNESMEQSCEEGETSDERLGILADSDTLLFVFPLYVDSLPSNLTACLEDMEKIKENLGKSKNVYVLALAGLHEGIQTHVAIDIIENWCIKMNYSMKGAAGYGGSGALPAAKRIKPGQGIKENLQELYSKMADAIINEISMERIYMSVGMSREEYHEMSEYGFRKLAKRNGLTEEDLGKRWNVDM